MYCCTRKILKETVETISVLVTFLSLVAFQLGGRGSGFAYVPKLAGCFTPFKALIRNDTVVLSLLADFLITRIYEDIFSMQICRQYACKKMTLMIGKTSFRGVNRAWYGMEWNGTDISVWNMEDARMEWKISRMEWKTTFHTSIPFPYQISCIVFTEKYIPMSGSDKSYCHRSIQLQHLRILFVDKSRYFGCVHCANSVRIASLIVTCKNIAI